MGVTASRAEENYFGEVAERAPPNAGKEVRICPLYQLLRAAFGCGQCESPFFRQVLVQVASHVDAVWLTRLRRGGHPKAALRLETADLLSLLSSPTKIARELLKHTVAQREATRGVTNLGMATDKGHMGAMSVAPFIYALPTQQAFVGCPQVAGLHRRAERMRRRLD